ncbi:septum formation protein [Desulfonispora thiosulfatigenes DSM 11270]|uniref:dTTP/UTP pyrophosphatase n=1 Tax=Desulfonispora thiosulfatigenes DSM 11270 TaxID=656914 RepID=A0A1W1VGQ7_DESTI|nr:septum formation protein [Desulfonispora thiosulfatigenes DSM 11270]
MEIILASASPRRSKLLTQIGVTHKVHVSNVEENYTEGIDPKVWVKDIALLKALEVAKFYKKGIVIGADTIVVKDGFILGKPEDERMAMKMLEFLSGDTHEVMTGIALVNAKDPNQSYTHVETTKVLFRKLNSLEISNYVNTKEPMDKAGSYAIQGVGTLFVEGIEGCYNNVVGLPLNRLAQMLKRFNVEVLNVHNN